MKYAVNEAGVQALNAMADAVEESVQRILELSASVRALSDSYGDMIGPHKDFFDLAIDEIVENIRQAAGPADDIAEKLADTAEAYEEIIENDRIKGAVSTGGDKGSGGGASAGAAAAKGSSFFGALFRRKGKDEAVQFSGFDTGKMKNGVTVLKGNHFDQYIQEYYDSDNFPAEPVTGDPLVEIISPSDIEGVHLSDGEVEDPSIFWDVMHGFNEESYAEIASHIPEVQAALDSGRSLEDLKDDPVLGTCAKDFFDPKKMPQAEKRDGYYTFDGSGRHRIITARKLGYDIPVRITNIRRHK